MADVLTDHKMMESVIPYFEMEDGELTHLELFPIELGFGEPRYRLGNPRFCPDRGIVERLAEISAPYGTEIAIDERGIGIVNVAKLFGMGAVKTENEINLVVNIVPWNQQTAYARLGLDEQYTEILGVQIPMNTIPVTPGRNLAVILEVAAMNNRQRKMGYNPALEFTEQINRHFDENMGQKA